MSAGSWLIVGVMGTVVSLFVVLLVTVHYHLPVGGW